MTKSPTQEPPMSENAKLRKALQAVHDDLLLRAEIDGDDKIVAVGRGVWCKICEALSTPPSKADADDVERVAKAIAEAGGSTNWEHALECAHAALSAIQSRDAGLGEALKDVVDPLGKLRRDAEAEGRQLSGMAYSIANDLSFVQSIARAALQMGGEEP